jgi:hypothetical protein
LVHSKLSQFFHKLFLNLRARIVTIILRPQYLASIEEENIWVSICMQQSLRLSPLSWCFLKLSGCSNLWHAHFFVGAIFGVIHSLFGRLVRACFWFSQYPAMTSIRWSGLYYTDSDYFWRANLEKVCEKIEIVIFNEPEWKEKSNTFPGLCVLIKIASVFGMNMFAFSLTSACLTEEVFVFVGIPL